MTDSDEDFVDNTVAFAKIFPPIGIARVGDSPEEFFYGPELTPCDERSSEFRFKDADGRIKRQAARFRIYGFNAGGQLLGELTSDNADVTWTVHLANKKAAWFEFKGAARARAQFSNASSEEKVSVRRNPTVGTIERNETTGRFQSNNVRSVLEIDGGARSIFGAGKSPLAGEAGDDFRFKGAFKRGLAGENGHEVYLGEIRTDDAGRLVVLGGRGASCPVGPRGPVEGDDRFDFWIVNYANNNDWHDDTSDGPVSATVCLKDGTHVPVQGGAWVIVAPPDFAPDVINLVTLYDVMEEVAIAARIPPSPGTPQLRGLEHVSVERDIHPLLSRLNDYRWVSPLGLRGHGLDKPGDAGGKAAKTIFAGGDEGAQQRERFFGILRAPTYPALDPATGREAVIDHQLAQSQANSYFMPPLSGDEGDRTPGSPERWLTLTRLQYARMGLWRDGKAVSDKHHGSIHADDEPTLLTKNTLQASAGGAFFPGIEMTSIARDPSLYCEPFRFDHTRILPGDVTKFMACPWQADFYECRDDWWPAQRPDSVITDVTFDDLYKSYKTERRKIEALLFNRERWDRGLERKPRPSRIYILSQLLPQPDGPDADVFAERVASIAADFLVGLTQPDGRGLATYYRGFAKKPLQAGQDAERLPSPWRLQYMIQEELDGYSGRYFLPTAPSPTDVLKPREVPESFSPPSKIPDLAELRKNWATLRVRFPAFTGFLIGSYCAAVAKSLRSYLKAVVLRTPVSKKVNPDELSLTPAGRLRAALENAESSPSTEPWEFEEDSDAFRKLRAGEFVDQLVSGLFLAACNKAPDMAMVDRWSAMGFVRRRVLPAEGDNPEVVLQLETERRQYDGKTFRDYFYFLMNISEFPDFEPYARIIVIDTLNAAQRLIDQTSIFDPFHPESFVEYSPEDFAAKLEQIYEVLRSQASSPPQYSYQNTRRERVDALTGNAPFNQVDGAWLRYVANAGTMNEVTALLFAVWGDEVGNGDPSLHHGNLYTTLLRGLGVYLPEVSSRAYADDERFSESTFVSPVFELAISLHSQEFFPELLGMTLYLEWEVLSLVRGAKALDYFGIDSQFFRMHIGIDNATEGHGAKAKRAVQIYLDGVLRDGGPVAQQDHWKRIWRGFVAFATAGFDLFANIGPTLQDGMSVESENARHANTPADKVAALIERKATYGALNHLRAQLGQYRINDLFDDPLVFMAELSSSPLVTPGRPDESRFLTYLTTFQGPMYKVFSDQEILLWREWIEWLGLEGTTSRPRSHITRGSAMEIVIAELRALMIAARGHQLYKVPTLKDVRGHQLQLAELFKSPDVKEIMRILADPENGWVVPYRPAESVLVVDLMRPGKPMGAALDRRIPELFNQVARMVVYEWIAAGCPIPGEAMPPADKAVVTRKRQPRLFVQQYGMGAVH
ncbi:LodA/GoxA family CTQ-dependent oxidase [Paraburkholderia hospita]|uniref:LodA/GoxA family CTQ-dependent oxidase n=1 Tax=Paraburkholderia hospita TaxID=169430 RepID=UPI000271B672|nr:LodA/GoxA family CTQ-dependent oxidase [Paraburkholderia hospita]EUC12344.1 hypothetical protein PMI06_008727 [Burkholderia sp. BT03]SKC51858.1 Iron-containing redox enzyme [Paraburkholderia hospita]